VGFARRTAAGTGGTGGILYLERVGIDDRAGWLVPSEVGDEHDRF
jgi:hypothetical protein